MTKQCENCKELDKRMIKWLDHAGCSPRKYQRYDSLLIFVKNLAEGKYKNISKSGIERFSQDLLEEIGEND